VNHCFEHLPVPQLALVGSIVVRQPLVDFEWKIFQPAVSLHLQHDGVAGFEAFKA
jgi:hypothetical protein